MMGGWTIIPRGWPLVLQCGLQFGCCIFTHGQWSLPRTAVALARQGVSLGLDCEDAKIHQKCLRLNALLRDPAGIVSEACRMLALLTRVSKLSRYRIPYRICSVRAFLNACLIITCQMLLAQPKRK